MCTGVPGAQRARNTAYLRIAALGAQYVSAQILQLQNPISPEDIRAKYRDPSTVREAFTALDVDADGKFSLSDMARLRSYGANADPTGAVANVGSLQVVIGQMIAELQLGAGGEDLASTIGVTMRDLPKQLCGPSRGKHSGDSGDRGNDDVEHRGGDSDCSDCPLFATPLVAKDGH